MHVLPAELSSRFRLRSIFLSAKSLLPSVRPCCSSALSFGSFGFTGSSAAGLLIEEIIAPATTSQVMRNSQTIFSPSSMSDRVKLLLSSVAEPCEYNY